MSKEQYKTKVPYKLLPSNDCEYWQCGCNITVDPVTCETKFIADGVGYIIYTVIDRFKPKGHQERTFYTMEWINPNGERTSNKKLLIHTTKIFKKRTDGYHHAYEIV